MSQQFVLNDEYILSHILSYLKVGKVFLLGRISSTWKEIIQKFYFFQFKEFYLDRYFAEYFSCVGGSINRTEGIDSWKRRMLTSFSKYLLNMHSYCGTFKSVMVMNLFDDFWLDFKIIKNVCVLFPSIEVFRISFPEEHESDNFIEIIEIMTSMLKNLKEIQMISCAEYSRRVDKRVEQRGIIQIELLSYLEQISKNNSAVSIKIVDSLTFYMSNFRKFHSKWNKIKQFKKDADRLPYTGRDYYNLEEVFSTDEELLDLIQENEWMLKFQFREINILLIAIELKFMKSVDYILKNQPDTLYRGTIINTNFTISKVFRQDMIICLESLAKLHEKSECFIHEEIPMLFNSNIKSIISPIGYIRDADKNYLELAMKVFGNGLFQDKILKYQTGLSTHHYILTYLNENQLILDQITDWYLDNEDVRLLLGHIVQLNRSLFERVTREWTGFNEELVKNYKLVDNCKQNILHNLFSQLMNNLIQYRYLKKICPSISELLFLPDILNFYPIQNFFTKHFYIENRYDLVEELINDMRAVDEDETKKILRHACIAHKHFTVLYALVKFMGGIDFLEVEDLNFAISWFGANPLQGENINRQYYNLLDKGYVNPKRVNSHNQTLLHQVALAGINHSGLYILLAAFGCEINALDEYGNTVSHYCIEKNQYLLKKMGADPNIYSFSKGKYSFSDRGRNLSPYTQRRVDRVLVCPRCLKYFTYFKSVRHHNLHCR